MRKFTVLGTSLPLFLALSVCAKAQNVIVVDDDPGNRDSADIAPAVVLAAPGDIVLVRAGQYGSSSAFVRVPISKPLTLIAEEGARVSDHAFDVRNLSADEEVVIRGIDGTSLQFTVEDSAGTVWLEDLRVEQGVEAVGEGTIHVVDGGHIVVTRCEIQAPPPRVEVHAGTALINRLSTVSVWDSVLVGGIGAGAGPGDLPGGSGVETLHGGFYLCDSVCQGGAGGASAGGCGIVLGTVVSELGATFSGGSGSPPGRDICFGGGGLHSFEGTPRRVSMSAPNRYGTSMSLDLEGLPRDFVLLSYGFDPGFQWVGGRGPAVIDPAARSFFRIGFLPGSGLLYLPLNTPTLQGLEGLSLYAQGWFFDPTGLTLSAPSVTVLVDPQF